MISGRARIFLMKKPAVTWWNINRAPPYVFYSSSLGNCWKSVFSYSPWN